MKKHLSILIGPFFLFALWKIVATFQLVDTFFLPDPFVVLSKLVALLMSGALAGDILSTLFRVSVAIVVAVIVGLPLGLWLGRSEKIYRSVEFIIDFFRSTPSTALFPLFLLIFGVTDTPKIAIAAFASTLIIIFNTAHGVMHARKSRVLAAKIMGATEAQIFRWVLFWESLPQTFVGLRNAVSVSLVVVVASEMVIGTVSGIGRKIIDSQMIYEIPTMYATILLAGCIGYLLNLLLLILERRVLHWVQKT